MRKEYINIAHGFTPLPGGCCPFGTGVFCDCAVCDQTSYLPTRKYEQYLFNGLRRGCLFATFTMFAYVLERKWSKVAYVLERKWSKVAYVLERILYICLGVSID